MIIHMNKKTGIKIAYHITDRKIEYIALAVIGFSNKRIAEILNVEEKTVKQVLGELFIFKRIVDKHQGDRYFKSFRTWEHFVSIFLGQILKNCNSLRDIEDFLLSNQNHVLPPRSPKMNGYVERANETYRYEFWNVYEIKKV